MTERVAIVATGLIGQAWAIAFARAGWEVRLWDPVPAAAQDALVTIADLLWELGAQQLLDGQDAGGVRARVSAAPTLADALAGAAWMQENAPERLEVKRQLWAKIDATAALDTLLASSTSAIVPSAFTETLDGRARCLVAHPLNPPYLIPAIELVPAPWTAPETMQRAEAIMRAIGQAPITMRKEIDGFVMNRLQGALLEEAFRLIADGVCSVEDVDIGLREGLALRWCLMGPFETIDLNAPGGVRDYVLRYQQIYEHMFPSMQRRVDWAGPVLGEVERQRRARLAAEALAQRQRWRDLRLMALMRHKQEAAKEIGD